MRQRLYTGCVLVFAAVMALVAVEPTRTLFVTGGGSGPEMQELVLAIARTVTVGAR